jgi:xylulokinase
MLSAASCLTWIARATGAADEAALLAEVEAADAATDVVFLPYLSGERTPHDDPHARGVLFGLSHDTTRAALGRAVLEGVAFAFVDGQAALADAGAVIEEVALIGGGARSALWGRILASALGRSLGHHAAGEVSAGLGAARLARLAVTGEDTRAVCVPPPLGALPSPLSRSPHRICDVGLSPKRESSAPGALPSRFGRNTLPPPGGHEQLFRALPRQHSRPRK